MIKNSRYLSRFNREQIEKENIPYPQALKIFEALYKEAYNLNALSHNSLDGIEIDIKIAKILNGLK